MGDSAQRTAIICGAAAVLGFALATCKGRRVVSAPSTNNSVTTNGPVVANPVVRVGVSAFLVDPVTGFILVGVRKSSHGAGSWHTPGGHLEMYESWADCYVRELREETGIVVDLRSVKWCGVTNDIYAVDGKHYITVHMYAEWDEKQSARLLEPDKCTGWTWEPWEKIRLLRPLFQSLRSFDTTLSCKVPQGSKLLQLRRHIRGKVIFLLGYPGSGKGTQGKILAQQLKIQHVSTGELYRAEAKTGSALGLKMAEFMKEGKIIPKEYTFQYLKQELSKPKYDDGFMLDGYPKDLECLEYIFSTIQELGKQPLAALWFAVTKNDVEERLLGRLFCPKCEANYHRSITGLKPLKADICDRCQSELVSREDDTAATIQTRLDNYDKKTQAVADAFAERGFLKKVDASQTVEQVNRSILNLLTSLACPPLGSHYLSPLLVPELSSKWHNHMDAQDDLLLRELITQVQEKVPEAQMKVYPISFLRLCAQTKNPVFARVYRNLPNFHPIDHAQDEAFSTGKMGEAVNYEMIKATLEACFRYPRQGVMTEIEEDLFSAEVALDGTLEVSRDDGDSKASIEWEKLPGWKEKMIKSVPRYELHHGVDIPKRAEDGLIPPISLEALEAACEGCDFGGLFIFTKEDRWSYRSNEFSNDDYDICMQRLAQQATRLRGVVNRMLPGCRTVNSCSLEKVHAIWQV